MAPFGSSGISFSLKALTLLLKGDKEMKKIDTALKNFINKRTSITATKQSVTSVHKSKIVFFTSIVAVE